MNHFIGALKKYATFSGRASRTEYWMFVLFQILIIIGLSILTALTGEEGVGLVLVSLFMIGTILPSLSVLVRRLHDTGRSGWWYFVTFVPFIGGFILLILLALESTTGDNTYGPNPYGIPAAASAPSVAAAPTEPTVPQA